MFLKLGILLLALGISLFAVAGIVIQQTGLMIVHVQDRNGHIFLPIPMIFVNTALHFTTISNHVKVPPELNRHYSSIRSVSNELLNCPDGPFVQVESPKERVSVSKEGSNLIIDINSDREKVFVQIPIEATGKTIAQLSTLQADQ